MKKLLTIVVSVLALVACNKSQTYRVAVLFPDASTEGQTVYLTSYDSGDTLAQATVENKNAVLEGEAEESYMARLLVAGRRLGFIVESGEITIKWDEGKATGSSLNDKLNALDTELEKAGESESAQSEIFKQAYEENVDNGIGPWAFNYYLMCNEFTTAQIDSLLAAMPARYRAFKRVAKAISDAQAKEATAVGKQFADFANGKGEKLSDYAGTGKYCLVDFWASWCPPCRKEIGNIRTLYDKYADRMNFVGIAVWDKDDDTRKAMEELGVKWPVIMNGDNWKEPTDLYGVSGIPHILLVAPDGTIAARGLAEESLLDTVDALFATK